MPEECDGEEFHYSAVDGGVVDNEPFELLQASMRARYGVVDRSVDRSLIASRKRLSKAQGAILLLDPFPSSGEDAGWKDEGIGIPETLRALLRAMRGQAALRPLNVRDSTPDDDDDIL